MKYLFLGGPSDGVRDEVLGTPAMMRIAYCGVPGTAWNPENSPYFTREEMTLEERGGPPIVREYHRVAMRGLIKPDLAVVYTYERPWRDYEIINYLLAHYRPENKT